MNYDLEMLEVLANWFKKQPAAQEHYQLIQDETKRLEKVLLQHLMSLTNQTQLDIYLQINLNKLVEICDLLYVAESIDNSCAFLVLDLLKAVRKSVVPITSQDLLLPLLLRKTKAETFEVQWLAIQQQLILNGTDPLLIDIIGFAFSNFSNARTRPKWTNYIYVQIFLDALEDQAEIADTDFLVHLLIRLGYNYSRFTAYCYRWIRKHFEGKIQDEKSRHLLTLKKEIRQLEMLDVGAFDPRNQSIMDGLLKWIDEELISLNLEPSSAANHMKINTKLKVLELAYWGKLQYDNGVYDETNLDILSEKMAFNFSSKFQEELSAASIKSKFYPKDRAIIEPIEEILVKMLDDVRQFRL